MKRISITNIKKKIDLTREVSLNNGNLVLLKNNDKIIGAYMVVSFRDNKNRYNGDRTASYCTLVNLESGTFSFEERCSRYTTVRRVLNHLLRLGCSDYSFNESIPDESYGDHTIEVYSTDTYSLDVILK